MIKHLLLTTCLTLSLAVTSLAEDAGFYAFRNGVAFGPVEEEVKVLKELGYTGISQVFKGGDVLAKRITAYEKAGMHVLSIYLNVNDTAISPEIVKPLANKNGMIELTVKKSTPKTVEAIRETAIMAEKMNIKVALYPHHGFAVATMPEALDMAKEVNHPNLGIMFNLCHFLKNENADDMESIIKTAGKHIFAVSTSGADTGGTNWGTLIQPLNKGSFPKERLFKALKTIGFNGPVTLQCYGVKGDKRTNLKTSIAAWKEIQESL